MLNCEDFIVLSRGGGITDFCFFQAEDGIRDRNVTGVQTCALPICTSQVAAVGRIGFASGVQANNLRLRLHPVQVELVKAVAGRSMQLPLSGVVTGTATVSGDTKTRLAGNIDVAHDDRGNHSQLTGTAAIRLASASAPQWIDVNVVA